METTHILSTDRIFDIGFILHFGIPYDINFFLSEWRIYIKTPVHKIFYKVF